MSIAFDLQKDKNLPDGGLFQPYEMVSLLDRPSSHERALMCGPAYLPSSCSYSVIKVFCSFLSILNPFFLGPATIILPFRKGEGRGRPPVAPTLASI